ncbi:Ultraviolet-B receptor UVR8 [Trichoplax sp. H2]|nr:Ultraviolet-B receptor UVR8 [Trichoplax sp. H2]|eukprot:RDD45256.1 Ultraviolet-B receptor UVR8 [Trichoplax sp. H2]
MTTENQVVHALKEMIGGNSLLKVGRNGKAHFRHFRLAKDLSGISWSSPRKDKQETIILVSQMDSLLLGQKTKVFLAKPMPELKTLSFSLLYSDSEGFHRSLDIVCQKQREFDIWIIGLQQLINGIDDKSITTELFQDAKTELIINTEQSVDDLVELDHLIVLNSAQIDQSVFGVYTWGSGINGALGHGEDIDIPSPRVVEALLAYNIKRLACGLHTVFALNGIFCNNDLTLLYLMFYYLLKIIIKALLSNIRAEDGKVYSWGLGKYGILGQGNLRSRFAPLKIASFKSSNVIDISCHELHAAAVTSSGELYTWGKGSENFNRLGYLCQNKQTSPALVHSLSAYTIFSVACGYNHTLAVTNTGSVYSFGDNSNSQLGVGDTEPYAEPQLVTVLNDENIIKVACGKYHSAALSAKGNLFLWGLGDDGQLGLGNYNLSTEPTILHIGEKKAKVMDVACGDLHTCILTVGGLVYAFGSNIYGQIAAPSMNKFHLPYRISFNTSKRFVSVSCGSFHSAAITENGKLYAWGLETDGRLGLGDCKQRSSPTEVEGFRDKKIGRIACGSKHTAALIILSSSADKKFKSSWRTT